MVALFIYMWFWIFGMPMLVAYWIERPYLSIRALDMLDEKTEDYRVYNFQEVLYYLLKTLSAGILLVIVVVDWLIKER